MQVKIAVVGLGYVGLPVALAFAEKFPGTVGFDIDRNKIATLKSGIDPTVEGFDEQIQKSSLKFTDQEADLKGCDFFVVTVPTPVDEDYQPDLNAVEKASATVGRAVSKGSIVVYESTVYPGVTEEICGPIIAQVSGLAQGKDFKLAYSPERIVPGDKEHTLQTITKIVSGEDSETLQKVSAVYGKIVNAGVFPATSIKVAEAAKVVENIQRDLNIALMNELAIIFDRLNIKTKDVLEAAGTKWNFLKFSPGLVGGHCIGVDPYYLTAKAEQLGYYPQVILAGRRRNHGMGHFIAQRLVKLMLDSKLAIREARVGVLGLTFKENVADIRNSRIPDIVSELREFGMIPVTHDPCASPAESQHEFGIDICSLDEFKELDALILAVPHDLYLQMPIKKISGMVKMGGVIMDVKSVLNKQELPESLIYWSL